MIPSKRIYSNCETKENFRLYTNPETDHFTLVSESTKTSIGHKVKGAFICAAFSSIDIKINSNKIIHLQRGEFYEFKEGETVTHKKYCGFTKFTKVNN